MIEAMAAARLVVATDVGGVGDVLVEGTTGLLVPPHQPGALADAMIAVALDPALRRRLGATGREAAVAYRAERLLADTRALYRQALLERRPNPS